MAQIQKKSLLLVGDPHGQWSKLQKIIKDNSDKLVIALGDVGFGFDAKDSQRKFPENFRCIRGNHDSPAIIKNCPNYLGDFGYDPLLEVFWMGGAASIDAKFRIEGVSWWRDEELSSAQLQQAFDLYARVKPKYVITHDCPFLLYDEMTHYGKLLIHDVSYSTPKALEAMWSFHRPKLWCYGHHHRSFSKNFKGTRFICLNELETCEVEISTEHPNNNK